MDTVELKHTKHKKTSGCGTIGVYGMCMVRRNIWGIIWSRQDCNQSSVIRVMSALRPGQALAQGTGTFTGSESKMQENTGKY